jgi:glutathione S-transferase
MTYRLYQMADSGNCYKVRLLMSQLELPFETIAIDITKGESRTEEFLRINPNGKIPTFDAGSGRTLAESNAILWYMARDSQFLPAEPFSQALVLQWFGFEQYSHEPNIATARYWMKILDAADEHESEIAKKQIGGYQALRVMEQHLSLHEYFVENYSIADIALFAYTHVCHEGGFSLADFPRIQDWIERVKSQPRFLAIDA